MSTPDANSSSTIHTSPVTTITKLEREHGGITKLKEPLDDTNWAIWREHIR